MTRAKRILLIAGMLVLSLNGVYGSIWHRKADKPTEPAAPAIAAMSLTAIETDASSPSRLLIHTSATPAYTSYSPAPDVFVVDLTDTGKAEAFALPATFPAGVTSMTAEEVTEMGNRLTRVTLHLAHPATVEASAGENAVIVALPVSIAAETPAVAPAIAVVAPEVVSPMNSTTTSTATVDVAAAEKTPVAPIVPDASQPVPAMMAGSEGNHPAAVEQTAVVADNTPHAVETQEPAVTSEPLALPKATSLKSVTTAGSAASMEVDLAGDGELAYHAFKLEKPSRLVIDINGVRNGVAKNAIAVNDSLVQKIRVSQFQSAPQAVTRVVLDLAQTSEYHVVKDGDRLRVTFGGNTALVASTTPKVSAPPATVAAVTPKPVPVHTTTKPAVADTSATTSFVATKNIDEPKPAAKGEPVVSAYIAASNDLPSQVPTIVESAAAASPAPPTPVATVAATSPANWKMPEPASKGATHVINAPADQAPPSTTRRAHAATAASSEDVFSDAGQAPAGTSSTQQVLSGSGPTGSRTLSGGDKIYTGEPLSLNLKDAEIKDVLRTFAQLTGLNIAVDPQVGGTVTVDFTDVPWDQALELILKQNGLTYTIEGNVMRVGTLDRIAQETAATRRLADEERLNVTLQTVSFKLSYARAADVQSLLREIASPRARIIVDTRTNQLIISEIPQYLQTMRNLIDSVDVATRQVVIEARIVETTKNFFQQYGFNWGFNGSLDPNLGTGTGLIFPNRVDFTGGPFNFGPGNPVLALTLGNVLGTFDLDLALNAAEQEGLVKVISAPRVTTQDNTAAEIQSGFQIPYQTRINFTTTVSYIDATLRLSVTPQITEAGTVIMDIQVQKTDPATGLAVEGGAGTPLSTRQAKTRLMVRDGGTSVIGGIYQTTQNDAQTRLPFVHQIPIIGNLFKAHNVSSTHDELLIFITPRIVRT